MLKKSILIGIVVVAAGWGILSHSTALTQSKAYQVLSKSVVTPHVDEDAITSADIIEATNKERVAVGLPPLSTNNLLDASAEIKVDDMIKQQYFEHQSPNGKGVSDLGAQVGYGYVIMGENLAMGSFSSSADVVTAWMNSPGHKANMLNKKYKEIGVSAKHGMYEGKEVWFAVQHFGTSRAICPSIDTSLKQHIDATNQELQREESAIRELKKALEQKGASEDPAYQSNIEKFNKSVDAYNKKLSASRQEIAQYNVQVQNFNKCIATFQ